MIIKVGDTVEVKRGMNPIKTLLLIMPKAICIGLTSIKLNVRKNFKV